MQIKDFRVTPAPPDFPVIREPGNFPGWTLSVELHNYTYNVGVYRKDSVEDVARKLRLLADLLEKHT